MIKRETPKLVLASASQVRAAILGGAGIDFDICPSQVDEDLLKGKIKNGPDLALALAGEKARAVALEYPAHLVLGADQILSCNGKLFDKPRDMDEARENLIFMRGKTHQMINGMVLVLNGQPVWQNTASASLNIILAPFPPSSKLTLLKSFAAFSEIKAPALVEPVKETMLTSG